MFGSISIHSKAFCERIYACSRPFMSGNVSMLKGKRKDYSTVYNLKIGLNMSARTFSRVAPMKRKMKQNFTVCVEGNIASGKSLLLQYFQKFSSVVEVHEEPMMKWRNIDGQNVLAMMYEDPSRWSGMFQSYNQLTMTDIHTCAQKLPVKLMERSLFSGRYCFIENLHRNKLMADIEHAILTQWFDFLVSSNKISVDLIVYLKTDPELVLQRIKSRDRPEEQTLPLKYIHDLHTLHEEWLIGEEGFSPPAPVLVLDGNQDLKTMYNLYEEKKSEILCGMGTS